MIDGCCQVDELLPCPFCGGEQTIRRHNEHVLLTASNHKRGCIMRELLPFIAFDTEAEAIAAWNTRADMSYEDALILLDELGLSGRTCKNVGYYIDGTRLKCSACGYNGWTKWASDGRDRLSNYCPNCGAKVVEE